MLNASVFIQLEPMPIVTDIKQVKLKKHSCVSILKVVRHIQGQCFHCDECVVYFCSAQCQMHALIVVISITVLREKGN